MTAINKDGQMYWTFEELDLIGERLEVMKEIKTLQKMAAIFRKKSRDIIKNGHYENGHFVYDNIAYFHNEKSYDLVYQRIDILWDIAENLEALINRGVSNG